MVGAGEAALTDLAAEGLGASVFSYVAGQLVGAGKTPLAGGEVTSVWLLACMYSLVSLEVGALGVGLAAHGEGAVVDAALLQLGVVLAVVLDGGAAGVGVLGLADPRPGHHGATDGPRHGHGRQGDGEGRGAAEDGAGDVALGD